MLHPIFCEIWFHTIVNMFQDNALSSKKSTAKVNHSEFERPKKEFISAWERPKQKPRDFLNFNYSQPKHSFDGSRAKKNRKNWNSSRHQVYNKETYLQAKYVKSLFCLLFAFDFIYNSSYRLEAFVNTSALLYILPCQLNKENIYPI